MREIQCTKGLTAIVDDEDYERLQGLPWIGRIDEGTYTIRYYAEYRIYYKDGRKPEWTSMHRMVLGLSPGDPVYVDHINGNGLDNRKENLRICTNAQNTWNKPKFIPNATSKYKGVSWKTKNRKWVAQICINGKKKHLGLYDTEEEAKNAYDEFVHKHLGDFGFPNSEEIIENSLKHKEVIKTSKYRGVSMGKSGKNWIVIIKNKHLGLFSKEEDAARYYDRYAIEVFGEKAKLNFPGEEIRYDITPEIRQKTSKYRGVSWNKGMNRWVVVIRNKRINYFENEEEAAREYDRLAFETFGEKAKLNFPRGE